MFPSCDSCYRRRLSSTGSSRVCSPASTVLRSVPTPVASWGNAPFSSRNPTSTLSVIRSCSWPTPMPQAWKVGARSFPYRSSHGGKQRVSQVPGKPSCVHALLSDPGGISIPSHCGISMLPSAIYKASASTLRTFRGSITRPIHSLSTLRSAGYPNTTQDSLPVDGWPLPGGVSTRWVSYAIS